MKIATWNVNSIRVRLPHILKWLKDGNHDVLCLQETKVEDKDFPEPVFTEAGYNVTYSGQKTYNGVAIVSRHPLTEVNSTPESIDPLQKRIVIASVAGIRLINVYVPNGSEVGSEKYEYKLQWLEALTQLISRELQDFPRLVVLGDFNIAPEDRDVYDPEGWEGSVLVSDKERRAFRALLKQSLVDVYRNFDQEAGAYSWWDYRAAAFRRNLGLRIDHILCSEPLAALCRSCVIDKTPRSWERPSDHAPVIAEFET
ncbi:MAG: exodeoxyribonuclease III [Gammaproteobacteria bacterium]|nr:exodeoxyribonuclease III [Gammaproteobacteria bacterium]